jgi:hypothetical protein
VLALKQYFADSLLLNPAFSQFFEERACAIEFFLLQRPHAGSQDREASSGWAKASRNFF